MMSRCRLSRVHIYLEIVKFLSLQLLEKSNTAGCSKTVSFSRFHGQLQLRKYSITQRTPHRFEHMAASSLIAVTSGRQSCPDLTTHGRNTAIQQLQNLPTSIFDTVPSMHHIDHHAQGTHV